MKPLMLTILLLTTPVFAGAPVQETWTVDGKVFTTKAETVRYIISLGRRVEVKHERCEIMTNKLSFKACPKAAKNKAIQFENQQFESLSQSK